MVPLKHRPAGCESRNAGCVSLSRSLPAAAAPDPAAFRDSRLPEVVGWQHDALSLAGFGAGTGARSVSGAASPRASGPLVLSSSVP